MNENEQQIKDFFTPERRKVLSVNEIERRAGLPRGTLNAFLNGEKYRVLTKDHIEKLTPILKEFGF